MSNYIEVEIPKFNKILDRLGDEEMVDLSRFDLIVHAKGGQTSDFYESLEADSDVEVLKKDTTRSPWLKLLLSILPTERGLVRVLNPSRLKSLFSQMGSSTITELFYIPKEFSKQITSLAFKGDEGFFDLLEQQSEYVYIKAQLDDYVQHDSEFYYVYDCRVGNDTAAVIRTVFKGL